MSPTAAIRWILYWTALCTALVTLGVPRAHADSTHVAVAANFSRVARDLAQRFEQASGHQVVLSSGSTGQLFTQIAQGAPFEVFLAADETRPRKALEDGLAVPDTAFTYAVGRLVLFSTNAALVRGEQTLREAHFEKLAIANPVTAPYGAAAMEVLTRLGVLAALQERLVRGTNIAQTHQFVVTGNAELGFVALSQISDDDSGSRWIVPASLHTPIRQDGVLLRRGAQSAAARAFLDYLQSPAARRRIEAYGYTTAQ